MEEKFGINKEWEEYRARSKVIEEALEKLKTILIDLPDSDRLYKMNKAIRELQYLRDDVLRGLYYVERGSSPERRAEVEAILKAEGYGKIMRWFKRPLVGIGDIRPPRGLASVQRTQESLQEVT